jgi:hypothetical protein
MTMIPHCSGRWLLADQTEQVALAVAHERLPLVGAGRPEATLLTLTAER